MTRTSLTTHLLAWLVGVSVIGCAGDEDVKLLPIEITGGGGNPGMTSGNGGSVSQPSLASSSFLYLLLY